MVVLSYKPVPMSCGFAGNADIYGIGIRIGYYTQAIAIWFSNYFLYREAKALRAANNLFLFALLVAATIYFATASNVHAIEGFLMLQIGLVVGLIGITERSRYTSKYVNTSKERSISRILTIMAGGFFNVCFWWKMVDVMMPTPCNGNKSRQSTHDATYIFWFYKASIYGWVRTLMKIQSLAAIVWTAPKIVTFDVIVLLYNFRLKKAREAFVKAIEHSPFVSSHERQPQRKGSCPSLSSSQSFPAPGMSQPQRSHSSSGGLSSGNSVVQSASKGSSGTPAPMVSTGEAFHFLDRLDDAIDYLKDLFSIYPPKNSGAAKKQLVHCCGGRRCFTRPRHESQCTDKSVFYIQCLLVYLKSTLTNKPSFDLKWMIALHMTASGQHPWSRWPRLLHRMYVMGEAKTPPDWQHVAIASDILLTQIPLVISSRTWMLMAAWQFLFIVVLVLQVELTIAWNHISGLSSLSSLGQLIPFILGVGGLIKVLWAKWRLVCSGMKEEDERKSGEYEEAMARFLYRKDAGAKGMIVRAFTA